MIKEIFKEIFQDYPIVVRSPGRINLIGEHTDYNEGFVLPAAIDKYIEVAVSKRNDKLICLYSVQHKENFEVRLSEIKPIDHSWTNYILGIVDQLLKRGNQLTGFNLVVDGDVPTGAGLSSSAAMECAACFAFKQLFDIDISKLDIALTAQRAEHSFAKVNVGIMDMFASVFGKIDHALQLDCRSLEFLEVPVKLDGFKIVLLNTNVKHSLASTAYNKRREECSEGVSQIKKHVDGISSLRDVTVEMIEKYIMDAIIKRRCRYVVEENLRVIASVKQMQAGNIDGLGEQMYRSHEGLSKEYEVSCTELDYLVNAVKNNPLVSGARMMGGGFGGCTINIVRDDAIDELVNYVGENYKKDMGKEMTAYIATTANGTELMK
ncbi:MAG: galactokinase [Flavitalea sp.]